MKYVKLTLCYISCYYPTYIRYDKSVSHAQYDIYCTVTVALPRVSNEREL